MKTKLTLFVLFLFLSITAYAAPGIRISDYPNMSSLTSNKLFVIADPGVATYNSSFGQLTNQVLTSTELSNKITTVAGTVSSGPWVTNAATGGYTNQAGVYMLNNGAFGYGTAPGDYWYLLSDGSVSFGNDKWVFAKNGANFNGLSYTLFPAARGGAGAFLQDSDNSGTLLWSKNGSGLTNLNLSGSTGTNLLLTAVTNYGTVGRTNFTYTDGAGWHNTNTSAASQGVDISRGSISAQQTLVVGTNSIHSTNQFQVAVPGNRKSLEVKTNGDVYINAPNNVIYLGYDNGSPDVRGGGSAINFYNLTTRSVTVSTADMYPGASDAAMNLGLISGAIRRWNNLYLANSITNPAAASGASLIFSTSDTVISPSSIRATNSYQMPTNYVAANFAPTPGMVKIVASNGVLYKVTQLSTNLLSQDIP